MNALKKWSLMAVLVLVASASGRQASAQINRAAGTNWKVESSTDAIVSNPFYYNPTPQPENPVYPAPSGINQHWSYSLPLYYVPFGGTASTNVTVTANKNLWVTYYAPALGYTSLTYYIATGQTATVSGWNWFLGGQLIVGIVEADGPDAGRTSFVDIN